MSPRGVRTPTTRVPVEDEVGDLGALEDPRSTLPRALGHRHRHVDRVGPALVGRPEAVDDVVGAHQRDEVGHLARRQHLLGHPHRAHVRRLAAEALVGARSRGELEVAALAEARGEPRLRLQPGIELGGVARHPQRVLRRAARDDLARRVPRGARRELLALQEHHVGRPEESEVIGDRGADHAATDDDVLRPARQVAGGRLRRGLGPSGGRVDGGEVERHGGSLPLVERLFNRRCADSGSVSSTKTRTRRPVMRLVVRAEAGVVAGGGREDLGRLLGVGQARLHVDGGASVGDSGLAARPRG